MFAGWATSKDGTKVYNDEASVKNLTTENNKTITLYAVWELVAKIKEYEEENGIILNVIDNTKVVDYLKHFEYGDLEVKVYNKNNELLTNDNLLGTGSKVQFIRDSKVLEEYINVVIGDTTGDGEVKINDVALLYKYVKGKDTMSELSKKAGNVVKDNQIIITDVAKIYKYIKNKIEKLD